jgi:superfamily II DNA or RNA helicase
VLSLTAADPWLPASLDAGNVHTFASTVREWVRSGAVAPARAQLCLRVVEPVDASEPWGVELLVRDADEPSLVVPVGDLWSGHAPFPPSSFEEVLTSLGHLVRLAPELSGVLDGAVPAGVELDDRGVVTLLRLRAGDLEDAGIAVLLPSWWTRRGRLGLRAKVASRGSTPSAVVDGGFGLDQLMSFTWEAALGDQRLTKADLRALQAAADAKSSIVRVRGQWVAVDAAEIEAILRRAGTRSEASGADLLRAGLGIDSLVDEAGAGVVSIAAGGVLGRLLDDALHATIEPLPTPAGFAGQLRPYQERGVSWLAFLGRLGLGACLADDMGLGKTAQLIATLLADPSGGPTLVVCPVSVLGNWVRELERFAPQLSVLVHHGPGRTRDGDELAAAVAQHDVVLTTYSLVARDLVVLETSRFTRLVLDEAQQVKNAATAQSKAIARLDAPRRIALTGTPVENRLADLWSLMHVLNPGLLGSMRSFRTRFAVPIERDHDDEAAELLRRITAPFVLRRLKTDRSIIDDLPDKIELTERCPLTREQATLYRAVVDELLDAAAATDGIERRGLVLAGLMKLKQVCNHPAHFLRDGSALHDRSGKLTRIEELLDEIVDAGDKVLCFTQFAEWGELLRVHFTRRYGSEPLWLHGGVARKARDAMVQRFGEPDGPPIFLLSLKAGGTGLNLTAASHVIHLDRWWNPAVEDQATDRAFRIGQKRTVLVHKLVSTGTIEERIDESIAQKRALAQRVVGDGEGWLTELSTDELREVLALRELDVAAEVA